MKMTPAGSSGDLQPHAGDAWSPRHLAALLLANVTLALGALLVRLADTGPIAAGFWRVTLALPVLAALAFREPAEQRRVSGATLVLILGAGLFFALDLAAWHLGIEKTKLANAALFGNAGSLILMVWGLVAAHRAPRLLELGAIVASLGGAGLLMGGSLEISHANLVGDLFCLLAGAFYAGYILMLNTARERMGPFSVLAISTVMCVPVLLPMAILRGEAVMPGNWTPLLVLALSSQVIGQGFLITSLKHFTPLVIGLALLTQPAIAATVGWMVFGETLGVQDLAGMVLLAAALAMAKAGGQGDDPAKPLGVQG